MTLSAAGAVMVGLALVASGCAKSAPLAHTCSSTDRQFIAAAQLSIASLGLWADQFQQGEVKARDVASEAQTAATAVKGTEPSDYSLRKTQALLRGMFTEYARAMQATAKKKDAGPHIQRSYGLANFAHDVLVQAQPGLARRGCDVKTLL